MRVPLLPAQTLLRAPQRAQLSPGREGEQRAHARLAGTCKNRQFGRQMGSRIAKACSIW